MRFEEWRDETDRIVGEHLKAALGAAERGNVAVCARAARTSADILLRRFLEAAGTEEHSAGESVASLLDASAHLHEYFPRLRAEACLLDAGERSAASPDDLVDALMEIQFLVGFRVGSRLGFTVEPEHRDPRLVPFVTHSTTIENASNIFACGALFSFNECVRRGLLSGIAKGVSYLHDPRRYQDSVLFHIPDHKYLAGEKVANSQRKGYADEAMEEDYQPSVRLFFRRDELESLPGRDDDGSHLVMIRDEVSLDLMVRTIFPTADARDRTLARVAEPDRRARIGARCLAAPPGCCRDPLRIPNKTLELDMWHSRPRLWGQAWAPVPHLLPAPI
jgi:hypothetical protein